MASSFGWLDVDEIALALREAHPLMDPASIRFTDLARLVRSLRGFAEDPAHPVNERILETIQALWIEEREGRSPDEEG